ncbi:MAG: membrane protein [Candidatus Bathyarchaeota archaeon B24]|nr:MAG: membrane protein [Candidatus Bathyarchaeota archaeon B24]RLI26448.1 MAG: hypothetical protein DRO57_01010 [Candidatus Bathyarchaeota archaeon]
MIVMNFFEIIVEFLKPLAVNPGMGSLTILGLSALMTIFSTLLNKLIMSEELQKAYTKELSEYKRLMSEYKMKGDKKILIKIRKKEPIIANLSKKVLIRTVLRMAILLAFAWGFFAVIGAVFGPDYTIFIPFPVETPVGWFVWYFICIFASSLPLSKLLGISMVPSTQEATSHEEESSVKAKG